MKQKLLGCLRPRLALLLAAVLIAAMVPSLSLTAAGASPTGTWEERNDVYGHAFVENGTSVDKYTYYDAGGKSETVTVNHNATVGSKEYPISISSEADLILFGQQDSDTTEGKYYILDKDDGEYDMEGDTYSMLPLFASLSSDASHMVVWSNFKGVLIGNNATITNVYIRGTDDGYYTYPGLFGTLYGDDDNPCQIMDLTVELTIGEVSSDYYTTYVGGLAAEVYGVVSLSNVTVDVTVSDGGTDYTYVGGLIGYTAYSDCNLSISNCKVTSSIGNNAMAGCYGGLIAYTVWEASTTITDCIVIADDIEAINCAGGLVAFAGGSTNIEAENCTVTADIIQAEWSAGGLVGQTSDSEKIEVTNCTVTADNGIVSTDSSEAYAGTLIGWTGFVRSITFTGCNVSTVLTKSDNGNYYPTGAIGYDYTYNRRDEYSITYSGDDIISTIQLGSSDVYVALINGTELTSLVDGITAKVEASDGGSKSGSATVESDGDVTLDVCDGTKTYELTKVEGIIYLEDNTDDNTPAYWVTLDAEFTDGSGSLNKGDAVNLLDAEAFKYTVYFYDPIDDDYVDTQTVDSDSTVDEPEDPTKSGYDFEGWYTNDEFTTKWDFSDTVTKSMTLYANFVELVSTITKDPTPIEGLTYTGSAQELITAGTAKNGTMYYSLTGEDGDWSTDIPTATDAGTYTVYYKVFGDDNYSDTDVESIEVTIAEASSSSSSSSSHSGSSHSLSQTTSSSSDTTDSTDTTTSTTDTTTGTTDTTSPTGEADTTEDYVIGGDGGTSATATETFTDVAETNQYVDAIDYVVNSGLMAGTSATTFEPETSLTRGMIVTILHRLEGEPESDADHGFHDVHDSAWYAEVVAWAAEVGIASGYGDGSFGPEDAVTREQLAAILYRYAEYKGYDVSAMADLGGYIDADDIGDWAVAAMEWANAEALLDVKGFSYIEPQSEASRGEAASTLMTFVENIAK